MIVRVLVVSPYPTVRAGLRALLQTDNEIEVLGEAEGVFALATPLSPRPDVVLLDAPPAGSSYDAVETALSGVGVVVLGAEADSMPPLRGETPRGFLTRDAGSDEIAAALKAVAYGLTVIDQALVRGIARDHPAVRVGTAGEMEEQLTPRELEVLQLLAAGLPNKTIALRLKISEHTAKFHVGSVLAKLGASSRTEAVTTAARRGLLLL